MDTSTHSQSMTDKEYFAVIDTETNQQDEVMSIGVVIAHKNTYHIAAEKYYVITPECEQPAMYGYALNDYTPFTKCNRSKVMSDLRSFLQNYCVEDIFAYITQSDCCETLIIRIFFIKWNFTLNLNSFISNKYF